MSRIFSQAIGGYYPTPAHLVPRIAGLIAWPSSGTLDIADPCAGEGSAIVDLSKLVRAHRATKVHAYTCEMEATRWSVLKTNMNRAFGWHGERDALKGDAFCVRWDRGSTGVDVLYLNPPYDTDPVAGRLEHAFLQRFFDLIRDEGILFFVVPHMALRVSAGLLAQHFTSVEVYRFPEEDFAAYKQVVLVGRRCRDVLSSPDKTVEGWLKRVAEDVSSCPVLPELDGTVMPVLLLNTLDSGERLKQWSMQVLDGHALLEELQPWQETARRGAARLIEAVEPPGEVAGLLRRKYPVAVPPRPAHLAAGIAAGIYNGTLVRPDDPKSGLPAVLIKGVFDKEWRKLDERTDKNGSVTQVVEVQQPKLRTTVFRCDTGAYITLQDGAEVTGSTDLPDFNNADLLKHYGLDLLRVLRDQCPPLWDGARAEDQFPLKPTARKLYQAQESAVRALVKLFGGPGVSVKDLRGRVREQPALLGEIGTGKCLGLGTPVLLFDGTVVPVEAVQSGDLLMGPDSAPRRVLSTTRGKGPLYCVTPTKGAPWVCNDVHLLSLVHTVSGEVFDVPAHVYANNKRLRLKISGSNRTTHAAAEFKQFFPENGVDFPVLEALPIDPYFLGVWYGDGNKDLHSVVVHKPDVEIREIMQATAAAWGLHFREIVSTNRCPGYRLSRKTGCYKNPLLDAIRSIFGDGARLPKMYLTACRDDRLLFLAGLLDTDGFFGSGIFEIAQRRKGWAEDICFLARSLGFRACMREKVVNNVSYWRVTLSGDLIQIPTRIPRKKASLRPKRVKSSTGSKGMKKVSRTGIRLEPMGEGEYAGFELDGDGRFLLGDFTVTHNTTLALALAHQLDSKRPLVLCPPHLLDTWQEEIAAVLPWARVRILREVGDVDRWWAERERPGVSIGVMSREAAKLGHAWGSVPVRPGCPACGAALPTDVDFAKKRARCEAVARQPKNAFARLAERLAVKMVSLTPTTAIIGELLATRVLSQYLVRLQARLAAGTTWNQDWSRLRQDGAFLNTVENELLLLLSCDSHESRERASTGLILLVLGCADMARALRVARGAYDIARSYPNNYSGVGTEALDVCQSILLLLPPEFDAYALRYVQAPLEGEPDVTEGWTSYQKFDPSWAAWTRKRDQLRLGKRVDGYDQSGWRWREIESVSGSPLGKWKQTWSWGDAEAAFRELLNKLVQLGKWSFGKPCGSPLFQALPDPEKVSESTCAPTGAGKRVEQPSPVRVPLAKYICKRYPELFDFLVLDEVHEYSNDGTAQEKAAHRLSGLKKPTLIMTGTLNNGYAESFFTNMHAISTQFRREFGRDDRQKFVRRYGYLKRVLEDKEDGKVVAFGTQSDRVQHSIRISGDAPGVLPLFLPAHLLRLAVTIHKADLDLDLPPFLEIPVKVDPSPALAAQYQYLRSALVGQIKRDMFSPLAGKLWGALAELPSYLDRASFGVGNNEEGVYRICYPQNVGGMLVAEARPLPAPEVLPKESWLVETLRSELVAGRNVMVFGWHLNLFPRLEQIIQSSCGVRPAILWADKVPTGKRKAWIDREIVGKKQRIMIVNPVAVQTGLNNLTWFSTVIWAQNPACNPIFYRQANGRIHRIGQVAAETRAYFPVYGDTTQDLMHRLLLHKVGVSLATDGLDPESALIAAGAAEGGMLDSLALGKQLFELLQKETQAA